MTSFLEEVARDLYARYGAGISDRSILFPSRRARLFFTEALSRIADRPMWQPGWTTVDELTSEISGLATGDRVRLITELFEVYSKFHNEPFDKFYFWGEMLLADFDTIDKYLIDATQLFRNLSDIKQIESDLSYLTPRQLQILSFWSSLGPEADLSEEKRRFLAIWKTLLPIYTAYRKRLAELGIAYNGMIQRAAAERIREGSFSFPEPRRYVVAGFNALSECEKRLFRFLSTAAETDFYWDYDTYYKDNPEQEAGMFVRENVAQFPPAGRITHDNMARPKALTAVAASSNAVQCKYVAQILGELLAERRRTEGPAARLGKETAVVLTDENLLLPLLYALPPELGKVNVTMGFPLRASLAYTFVERLLELQAHRRRKGAGWTFYHTDVTGILAHPYVADCDAALTRRLQEEIVRDRRISVADTFLRRNEVLSAVFSAAQTWRERSDYLLRIVTEVARLPYAGDDNRQRVEFLAVIAEEIVKLRNSLDDCGIDLQPEVYASLLRRHLQTLRIPFEGEPLEGIQVMGILETRNVDFEHVVLLSMNDDNFPGNHAAQGSFVPYNLRAAFALPTPEHHEGVYAYYFYRLVQRAETVHMLYCARADEKSTGEPSRYIYQLDYESGIPVRKIEVGVDVNLARTEPIEVPKDRDVMRRLERFLALESTVEPEESGDGDRSACVQTIGSACGVSGDSGADAEPPAKVAPTSRNGDSGLSGNGVPGSDPGKPPALSPTAFFRYVACPLRFYFHSVARLKTDEEVSEEVDAPMFGTILHAAAQALYSRIEGEHRPGETLRAMLRTDCVAREVERAINEHYLHDPKAAKQEYSGSLLLVSDIVTRYLRGGVMAYDAAHDGFTVIGLEREVRCRFPFRVAGQELEVRFAGIADRIDALDDGVLRVVDYKTGASHLEFDGVESLFHGEGKQRLSNILQTLLYAMMLRLDRATDAQPALYYVRNMHREDYSPLLDDKQTGVCGARYSHYAAPFEELVRETLGEMYDPAVPFRQCDDPDTCKFCDFNVICKR